MKRIYYGWWIVLASFMIAFYVAGVIFYGFTAFIEPLVEEFGWSYTQISLAASLRGLEMGLLAPLIGFLVDRFGSRKLLFSGVIVLGFGVVLLGFTQSLAMFYGAFVFIAFGAGGCTSVVTMTAVANWFDKNVGKAMGVMASGFGASGLIVPVIVWLIAAFGWRTTLIILGLGMWIIGLPIACIVRNKPEGYGYSPDANNYKESEPAPQRPAQVAAKQFKEILKKKSLLFLYLSETIRLMALTAVVTHIMPYLGTMEISRMNAGLMAAGIPLLSILGRIGFGWLGDIFEKKYAMAIAYSLMGLGMLTLCYVKLTGMIYIFLFFFSNGFGAIAVLRGAILREYYGRYHFGKLMGIMMGFGACGGIIGPTTAGWVFDRMESYYFVWLAFSGLIGLALILILKVESKKELT
ncbi:MAG: MFS transporter [Desulfobacterales bacterium]|nr:MAG: MFS transporter [Desulfobacterales bacterium]